jgi:D-lactate dehydrogenase (cytochrome)
MDCDDLKAHGYSDWSSINIEALPTAVVYPSCTEDVAAIARICYRYKVPMSEQNRAVRELTYPLMIPQVPFSGGSSVEGHFSAPFGGISVDFMNMNNVVAFHPQE